MVVSITSECPHIFCAHLHFSCTVAVHFQAVLFYVVGLCYRWGSFTVPLSIGRELHSPSHSLWDCAGLQFVHHISNCH